MVPPEVVGDGPPPGVVEPDELGEVWFVVMVMLEPLGQSKGTLGAG
jgi:hypothetical protein